MAIIKDVVAFLCSLGSLASWGAAAMYESKDEKFPVGKALILAGIVGFLVASFRVWKKTDDDLERANDSLQRGGSD